jgi:thiamine-phosphate pyrophosphorylase
MIAPPRQLPETDIYAITAHSFSLGRSNIEVVKALLAAGIRIIQYREKDLPIRQKYLEGLEIRRLTAACEACLIVNDDVDLALAVEADGVHIGQDDLPVEVVRRLVGEKMLIGISTHSAQQLEAALKSGTADYAGIGPLFSTSTKKDVQSPVGLSYLDYAVKRGGIPLVAIGGIKEHNVGEVIRHGARCVCLVSEIVGAPDIPAKVAAIRRRMAENRGLSGQSGPGSPGR